METERINSPKAKKEARRASYSPRGIGKGGASRHKKIKKVKEYGLKKKAKQSPRKSRSLKSIEKMARSPSRSSTRTRSPSRSSSGSIEIDREEIARARKEIGQENALRRKFNIPKEYKNDKLEDIPLRLLKLKKVSPIKKAKK